MMSIIIPFQIIYIHSIMKMEILESLRKFKRNLEAYFTYRRALIFIMITFCLILYGGPQLFRWISKKSNNQVKDAAERCLSDRLLPFYFENEEFNANILHMPKRNTEKPYLPFVGNGIFGLDIYSDRPLYIKKGRTLSLPVPFSPIVEFSLESEAYHEATVVQYQTGVVYKFQCFSSGSFISYQYYAHRTLPSLLVQDIKVTNPTTDTLHLRISPANMLHWPTAVTHKLRQAANLWNPLSTFEEVLTVTSLWLLTLEKQGCHNLLKAGASGAVQAMVLSFGSLRFSNQHLELNIHPKYLHRDFTFRRISYGNLTHVNISIAVKDDNKAVLGVALDRSDKNYYACDAGCLDDPVQLGPHKTIFPVKLTDPVTAILYITYDKQHMEDLRHAIHVKEVIEAPPHEHHVIALHKHGHHLGGLPTLFWVSICFLITVFHLFLCKLIYNEYCGSQDKYRTRYGKL
ncbi:hypothetical protein J437_LFUL009463 [Ladona fulva]|uniref:Uncharacterized protein n=1 Tax=Ladona fulva TaxID=123851 RepID=A0A8K0KTP9_LADFU|nr:hypothetical protein J437_LFUL009463 [Ladona fulva]